MKIKSKPLPTIFVVVLNYNGKQTLNDCLASVYQSDWSKFEVVVVDNNSTDGSFEQARKDFSRAHFIRNSVNLGFSKGNNIGIRFALEKFADYVLVLNNDALIERNTLSSLLQAATNDPKAGVVSPLIYKGTDIWFAGGCVDWRKMRTTHVMNVTSDEPYQSQFISGCAMFVKKEVFKQIGLFDERFFLYYEDADFSLRAAKAGFNLKIIPGCKIQHLEQSSANADKLYWLVLSALLFFQTHATFSQKVWIIGYNFLRRAKNWRDFWIYKTATAKEIRRAFKDFSSLAD